MAVKEKIIIEVTDNGMAAATDKANALAAATKNVAKEQDNLGSSLSSTGNSVLENGGAMGLLNDLTGGYAMMVKDAVEASVLFTKSQKLAAMQQKIYTLVMGTSTGAMKAFRIALISTGIGAIVVGVGLLIANFDKVKKVVMNLIPGLSIFGDILGGIVDAVTDFIGVTSDASRAVDKMAADAEASLKKSESFFEANGDKYDQYTQRKMQANIDYNKKVKELAEDEVLTDKEKLSIMKQFREKANREIIKADKDRAEEVAKIRKEAADKEAEAAKKAAEEEQRKRDASIAKEKERRSAISKILEDYKKKEEDALAKSNLEKINLEEKRALEELSRLKASENEKARVREYYNGLRREEEAKLQKELADIEAQKQDAQRSLVMDQKQWEVDNEADPILKMQKQRELLEEQGEIDLEKLQKDIANAQISAQERANAEMEYARVKQDLDQALKKNDDELAAAQKERDQSVQNNKENAYKTTANTIAELAGESSAIAKGVAVAQTTIDTIQSGVAAFKGMVKAVPGPVGIALGTAAAAGALASGYASVKKILAVKPVEKSAPAAGGGGAPGPAAPSFNLVQGTGANQIAEAVAGQGNQPVQAFVVSSNVTSAQSLDRNIIDNATL